MRRGVAEKYLTKKVLRIGRYNLPIGPTFAGIVLLFAQVVLITTGPQEAQMLLLELLFLVIALMAFYRWGVLEERLLRHSDLRLGVGKFSRSHKLPNDLPKIVLCIGGSRARHLISKTIRRILKTQNDPFELIVFHAEDSQDPDGFVTGLIQRVVSTQIVPNSRGHFVITVKSLPGNLSEGLLSLKKKFSFTSLYLGYFKYRGLNQEFVKNLESDLQTKVIGVEV